MSKLLTDRACCKPLDPGEFLSMRVHDADRYWRLVGRCRVLADGVDITRDTSDVDEARNIAVVYAKDESGKQYLCANSASPNGYNDHARQWAYGYESLVVVEALKELAGK